MSRATEDTLATLHGKVADHLIKQIDSGEPTAADIANALKMLKENNITALPGTGGKLDRLKESIALLQDEDNDTVVPIRAGGK